MSKKSLATGTSPFAHLLSGFRAKRAEDDEQQPAPESETETEEDQASSAEENESDPKDEGKRGKKAKRAEEDEDQDPDADDGDEDEAAAEEEMDDDERKAFRRGLALGRKRENARCSRIFGHEGAGARPDLAATLAFTTRNSSGEAGRLLGAVGGTTKRGALADRMSDRREVRPGSDGNTNSKPSFGARVAAATKKATGR